MSDSTNSNAIKIPISKDDSFKFVNTKINTFISGSWSVGDSLDRLKLITSNK